MSDHRTIAVVEPNCSITWMCAPRIDSAAIFAHLMDTENEPTKAGYFQISDESGDIPQQSYIGDTLVLKSTFENFHVTDYLDASRGRTKHQAGRTDLIRVIEGSGIAKVVFSPRLNFGRSLTKLVKKDSGFVIKGGNDLMSLRASKITWTVEEIDGSDTATAIIDLDAIGGRAKLELRCGTANVEADVLSEPDRRTATLLYWQKWVDKLSIPRLATDAVRRSAVTLKALCYRPSGAVVAAATTSLPETVGGVRNWDYRYCWIRDAAMTVSSLVRLGSNAEAMAYLDWLLEVVEFRQGAENLQPIYNVSGSHLAPEADISELSGYRSSRPVRINNGADTQVQLDVFGPVVELIYLLATTGEALATKHWVLVQDLVKAVNMRWKEIDCGIWEFRSAPRHYVYTKLMCWVAVDRAVKLSAFFTGEVDPSWEKLRDDIADEINEKGFKKEINSYTSAYDDIDVDATVLGLGLYGFIKMDDPRFIGTIEAVEKELLYKECLYRYHREDSLPGIEGAFVITSLWMVECYWKSGRKDDARSMLKALRSAIGKTGIMAEQIDPDSGGSLGNLAQCYSHLGYINTVLAMASDND